MANNRIKGITIEIGANTAKLTDALRDVDSSLTKTQNYLKDVNKLLKMDPGNLTLLGQKQDLLTKAVEDTNEKLRMERDALEQLKSSPDAEKTIDQQRRLEREIIATEAALKKYQGEIDITSEAVKANGEESKKLITSLKAIDNSLSQTKKELKDVDAALKVDPTNVDLLKQKQELLAKASEDARKKIELEKKALEDLKTSPDAEKTIEQQRKLEREITTTTNELKNYQKELKSTSPTLSSLAKQTSELADKTKALSAASAAAIAGLATMAVNAGATADDLNTLSKQTGFTTEELQKMKYASDLIDVSVEDMTGSIVKMTRQMASENEAFKTLNVSVKDTDGSLRDANAVWYETLQALSEIENETERDSLAMEIFGKSATSLAGIIDDGGEALRAYGQDAEDLGLILSQDTLDAANKLNDAIDVTKARLQATFLETGAKVAETMLPLVEEAAEKLASVFEWIASLDTGTIKLVGSILLFGAALSPVLKLISSGIGLMTSINGLLGVASGSAVPGLASAVSSAAASIGISMSAMLGWIALVVAAVGGLIAVFAQLKKEASEAKAVAFDQDMKKQGYTYVSEKDTQYYNPTDLYSVWNGSGWTNYAKPGSSYDWSAKNDAYQQSIGDSYQQNTYNMDINVSQISDLQDLINIADSAQLLDRMG